MKNKLVLNLIEEALTAKKTIDIFLTNGTAFKANKILKNQDNISVYAFIPQPNGTMITTTTIMSDSIIGFSISEKN